MGVRHELHSSSVYENRLGLVRRYPSGDSLAFLPFGNRAVTVSVIPDDRADELCLCVFVALAIALESRRPHWRYLATRLPSETQTF